MKKLMVKLLVFVGSFLLGMFLANILHAKNPTTKDQGLLWKIEGNGIETSYLFGTFHILGKSDFHFSDEAKSRLTASDKLAMELDLDDPNMQATMMQHAAMKGDNTLKQLLTEDEYQMVDQKVTEVFGTGLSTFDRMKPFVITSMLYPTLLDEETASYELTLSQQAMAQGKEIIGLESVEFQMSIFDKIPYETQADELVDLIAEKEMMVELFEQMIANYKGGNIQALQKSVSDYYEDPEFRKWLLDERNEGWIEQIRKFSSDQSVFYAVGAGHLGGEKGVVNLLREAGFRVTPIAQ